MSLSLYGNVVDKADAPYTHTPSPEIRKVWSQFCTYGTLLRPPRSTSGPGSSVTRAGGGLGLAGYTDLESRLPLGAT